MTGGFGRRAYTQKLLPGATPVEASTGAQSGTDAEATTKRDKAGGDHKLVRTDRSSYLHAAAARLSFANLSLLAPSLTSILL